MAYKPVRWSIGPDGKTARLRCPWASCGAELPDYVRGRDRWPDTLDCPECEHTLVIPVGLSRGRGMQG